MIDTVTHGFIKELDKSASIGSAFMRGAKASVPWSVGFHALGDVTKPPHVSMEGPGDKMKRLGKDVATGAAGFGAWTAAEEGMKGHLSKRKWYQKLQKEEATHKTVKGLKKHVAGGGKLKLNQKLKYGKLLKSKPKLAKTLLRKVKMGGPAILAGLAAAHVSEKVLSKVMGKTKEPKEYPLR